jgi:hypothetical protein
MTVSAEEFIRRFLLHALPPGCQVETVPLTDLLPRPTDSRDFYAALTGKNLKRCPRCGIGTMVRIQILGPGQVPLAIRMDTS